MKVLRFFLNKRRQVFRVNDVVSGSLYLLLGAAQNSVLELPLFSTKINDSPNACEFFKRNLNADNKKLIYPKKSLEFFLLNNFSRKIRQ